MAIVKCKECGGNVSSTAMACPHCGVKNPNPAALADAFITGLIKLAVVIVLTVAAVYACSQMDDDVVRPTDGKLDALTLCQAVIARTAKNPSSAHVPYASDVGSAGQHRFVWRAGDGLTMMNAFGANLDTTADCTTDGTGKKLLHLTVDDNTLF